MIPYVPSLKYKCINEPDGYKTIFNYSTPKQCPFYKKKHKKKKKKIIEQNIIVFYEFCYSDYVDFTFDFNYHWT